MRVAMTPNTKRIRRSSGRETGEWRRESLVSAMYAARMIANQWWVGFLYSNGRFDLVKSYKTREGAMRAATRMNKEICNTPL